MKGLFGLVAILSGIAASLLVVASILVYEGWIPLSYVDNFTATELAAFGVLFIVVAIAAAYVEKRE
jgi:hypothetical protein